MPDVLRARMRSQLRLALMSDCGCLNTLGALEKDARGNGMTGAEIDAALAGRSFEVRIGAALAFACALKAEATDLIAQARSRALKLGLTADELEAVELETRVILSGADR